MLFRSLADMLGCTGRLLGPSMSARVVSWAGDAGSGLAKTIQRTPSVHGGVVSDPS